jgi:prepilin-type processing-associated H-X9-DG protein
MRAWFRDIRLASLCTLFVAWHALFLTRVFFFCRNSALWFALRTVFVLTLLFAAYCMVTPRLRPKRQYLWQLLAVMVGISIPLGCWLYPTIGVVNSYAAYREVKDRMEKIGSAMKAFHDREHRFPASAIYSEDGKPLLSWRVALLPFLGHQDLYDAFKLDEPWDSPHNLVLARQMPVVYALPYNLDDGAAPSWTTYFQVFVGSGTVFEGTTGVSLNDFARRVSKTALVVIAQEPVLWTKPVDIVFSPIGPVIQPNDHVAGYCWVLFADGHVASVLGAGPLTDAEWRGMITHNSGSPRYFH